MSSTNCGQEQIDRCCI